MQTTDLSPLVRGIIVIVGIAIALGQYPKLERWAKTQALEAIEWRQGLPYFFPQANRTNTGSAPHDLRRQHPKQKF
jgi:hypothetical protein